jgi:hypothetical protein
MKELKIMIKWIKNFRNLVSTQVGQIIIVVLSLVALYVSYSNLDVLPLLSGFVPLVMVLVTVIGFALKGKLLPAHLILLLAVYRESGSGFINAVSSFDFESMSFGIEITLNMVLSFLVFVYLLLYVLSYLLDGKFDGRLGKSEVITSAVIAFIFFYFRSGFSVAVLKILPPVVALMFGSEFFAILLLLAGVIDVPFTFIDHIVEGTLSVQPISYFLFSAFAFYLIYGAVKALLTKKA